MQASRIKKLFDLILQLFDVLVPPTALFLGNYSNTFDGWRVQSTLEKSQDQVNHRRRTEKSLQKKTVNEDKKTQLSFDHIALFDHFFD
jgi:hypothetical protein